MTETGPGLRTDARARVGDEFLRFEFTICDSIDLGTELGAESARTSRQRAARNALFVAVLVMAWRDPTCWTIYSRDRSAYAYAERTLGPMGSYAAMMWAVETLRRAGLIHYRRTRPSPSARLSSTLRATPELLSVSPITHLDQLRLQSISDLLQKRDHQKNCMTYRETSGTRAWRADIMAQNEVLEAVSLELRALGWEVDRYGLLRRDNKAAIPIRRRLIRIFSTDWRHGGRWYGGYWQNLSECVRRHILIDGQPVVEIDYPNFHPSLLAAAAGIELAGDTYIISGFPRREVKIAFNILLNAETEKAAIGATQKEFSERGYDATRRNVLDVITAIKDHHSDFAFAWGAGIGLRLQNVDAEMCAEVQRIMRESGCATLSIHDSFIVEARQENRLRGVMDDVLKQTKRKLSTDKLKLF